MGSSCALLSYQIPRYTTHNAHCFSIFVEYSTSRRRSSNTKPVSPYAPTFFSRTRRHKGENGQRNATLLRLYDAVFSLLTSLFALCKSAYVCINRGSPNIKLPLTSRDMFVIAALGSSNHRHYLRASHYGDCYSLTLSFSYLSPCGMRACCTRRDFSSLTTCLVGPPPFGSLLSAELFHPKLIR